MSSSFKNLKYMRQSKLWFQKKLLPFYAFVFLSASTLNSQKYSPDWKSLDSRPTPSWFLDAKFGIFIHWGVYSVPAYRPIQEGLYASYAEWYYAKVYEYEENGGKEFHDKNYGVDFEYRDFGPMFKAELWNPEEWAKMFSDAGAKYVVLTSKHHDGYCLWPTKSKYKKKWNSMTVGPHRDLVGDLTKAVKNAGMRMGLYYSIIEWESSWTHRTETGYFIPNKLVDKYKIPEEKYATEHVVPQLKELVNQYEPSLIFSDGGEWDGDEEYYKTKEFLAWLYNKSPVRKKVVVNDRFAKNMPGKHGDYFSSEYKDAELDKSHPWEESRGIGKSYGFNRAENLSDYSSSKELIHELIEIVSKGGNFLLNVGPTADGRIPIIMQERLKDIGNWLKVNGNAIYGSRKSSVKAKKDIFFTEKSNFLYAILTKWKTEPIKIVLDTPLKIGGVELLGVNKLIDWTINGSILTINLPKLNFDELPCEDAWVLKITFQP
jgi:alpha-L-fucosidase